MSVTEEIFLRDVATHEMRVIRDEGVYRHVRFQRPGSSCMMFDLITWPGHLCYTGDMGTYVFSRIDDMFAFFRTDREYSRRKGRELSINLRYWMEKVLAPDRYDGLTEFDSDKFERHVMEHLVEWIRERYHSTTKEERRDLWESVVSEVIHAEGDSLGTRKQIAVYDFNHLVNEEVGTFSFVDFWEVDLTKCSGRFVWCCYALAWGIQKYDEATANTEAAA